MDESSAEPRDKPKFKVLVIPNDGGELFVDVTHAVMDVYDIAVNSMDMGSGFLDDEEVGNLRTLGKAIGAEHFDYQSDKCLRCGAEYVSHHGPNRTRTSGTICRGYVSPYKNEGVN